MVKSFSRIIVKSKIGQIVKFKRKRSTTNGFTV